MPLRELFYIADEYQKLVDTRSLYSSMIQRIPAPNFVVFYNGTKEIEDCQIHYLSEAFENFSGDPQLELKVKVLNVNEGHNQVLMEQCQILKEYAQYVAKVRCYLKEMPLDDAVNRAVEECIGENILADFLKKNRAEVIKVSIYEYDKELEEEKLRKAEYEAGVRAGITVAFRLAEKANLSRDDIIQQLCDEMHMPVEEAEKWYEEYKKEQT